MPGSTEWGTYKFALSIDGVQINHITEVTGLKTNIDVMEVKRVTEKGVLEHLLLPGVQKKQTVTLTRHLNEGSNSFEAWLSSAILGDIGMARVSATIKMMYPDDKPAKEYTLRGAMVEGIEISAMKAGGNEVATEKLTISYVSFITTDLAL